MLRLREPELMDDPCLDPVHHRHALEGLATINRFSGSPGMFFKEIIPLLSAGSPIRLLDVACGGGDVAIALSGRARKSGLNLQIAVCDISQTALDFASQHAVTAGVELETIKLNVLNDDLPLGFDVITCSLFAHHLDPEQLSNLLRKMAAAAGKLMLLQDLRRCGTGLVLAQVAGRLLSRSPIVHNDAAASVRAAYTIDEISTLAEAAGLHSCSVEKRWPCRYLLKWWKK